MGPFKVKVPYCAIHPLILSVGPEIYWYTSDQLTVSLTPQLYLPCLLNVCRNQLCYKQVPL